MRRTRLRSRHGASSDTAGAAASLLVAVTQAGDELSSAEAGSPGTPGAPRSQLGGFSSPSVQRHGQLPGLQVAAAAASPSKSPPKRGGASRPALGEQADFLL